ncbi:MAG TPA: sulfocyanin-like copper-binding protein [Gemmatimonadales bacterium]|nr:sulfocyanin-like copper-binding protein [Gemmatimonadales bacterium]
MPRVFPRVAVPLALLLAAPLAAQTGAGSKPDPAWLQWNPATRTMTFHLIAGMTGGAKSPFNFNGYSEGELTLVVPESANVVMNFVNQDGTPHSAEVIADKRPLPNMGIDPGIPRAYTRALTEGIAQFGTDVLRFKAAPAGDYLIFCGVPGHGLSGMWIRFNVSPEATEPVMHETPSSPG